MRTVLITGVSGFTAWHLVHRLRTSGAVSINGMDLASDAPVHVSLDRYLPADITDAESVATLVCYAQPDWVFHLAGLVGEAQPADIYRVNTLGAVNLLDACRRHAPDARILLVGTAAEYGPVAALSLPVTECQPCNPTGAYGISKFAATLAGLDFARKIGQKISVVRPFNIIGAGVSTDLVLGAVLQRIKQALRKGGDPVVKVGNIASARDFIAVEDVVDAYVRIMEGDCWGEVFNICSADPVTIKVLLDRLVKHSPRPITFETDPTFSRSTDHAAFYGSYEKAHRTFGFAPKVTIDSALKSAWDHAMREVGT